MFKKVPTILKAIAAGVFTGIGGVQTAYVAGGGHIGLVAALTVVGGVATAVFGVWGIPNKILPPAPPANPSA